MKLMSNDDAKNGMVEVCGFPSDLRIEQVEFFGSKQTNLHSLEA